VFRRATAPLLLPACALVLGIALAWPSPGVPWAVVVASGAAAALPRTRARSAALLLTFFALGAVRASSVMPPAAVRTEAVGLHRIEWTGPSGARSPGEARVVRGASWRRVGVAWDPTIPEPNVGEIWLVRGRLVPAWAGRRPPVLRVLPGAAAAITRRPPRRGLEAVRAQVRRVLDRGAGAHDRQRVLRALVLGESRGLPPRVRETFARTGTAHLLAISGLHVGMVAGLGALLARRPLRWAAGRWARRSALAGRTEALVLGAGVAIAAAYVVLAGAPVSSRRAWWMLAAAGGALVTGRGPVGWNLLAVAALAVAWTGPDEIVGLGSGLSFAAVGGLLAAAPAIDALRRRCPRPLRGPVVLLAVSAVATAATAPLVGLGFGRVPVAGIWANVAAIPALAVLLPLALIGASVGAVAEGVGVAMVSVADRGLAALIAGMEALATPAWSPVLLWQPAPALVAFIYAGWLLLLLRSGAR